jgi:cysteine desulfurase
VRAVYLDHNASTPLCPQAREAMLAALDEVGNPSSQHASGRRGARLVEEARERVAALVGASDPAEICFTAGGSEANALAVAGAVAALEASRPASGPLRVVTTRIEHPCVLGTLSALERRGVSVERVGVGGGGVLDLGALEAALRDGAELLSVMLANNEVGTLQPVAEAARLARAAGALVHVDAVQGAGKVPVDVRSLGVDLLAGSGHKMNGPKGAGFLYVRRGVLLEPFVRGGGQEGGLRAGTENTPGIAGLGAAAAAAAAMAAEAARVAALRDALWDGIVKKVERVRRFGDPACTLPGTLAVGFEGVHGEPLMLRLDMEGIAASTGSACHSATAEPSHVLSAMGVRGAAARSFLRLSLGHGNDEADVDYVLDVLPGVVAELRAMAPRRSR